MHGDEESRREEARQEKEVGSNHGPLIGEFCLEGGDLSGDEEKASRQEGCSEKKEVDSTTSRYAGGGTPQRHSYTLFYDCWFRQVEELFFK